MQHIFFHRTNENAIIPKLSDEQRVLAVLDDLKKVIQESQAFRRKQEKMLAENAKLLDQNEKRLEENQKRLDQLMRKMGIVHRTPTST